MDPISSPHNKFFKEIFAREKTAAEFLQNYLPVEVAGLLDWDSLESTRDSFVDKELQEYFSDLMLRGSWGF